MACFTIINIALAAIRVESNPSSLFFEVTAQVPDGFNRLARAISRRKCARPFPRYVWKNSSRRLDPLQFVQTLSSRCLATHFAARSGWRICPGQERKSSGVVTNQVFQIRARIGQSQDPFSCPHALIHLIERVNRVHDTCAKIDKGLNARSMGHECGSTRMTSGCVMARR